MAQQATPEFLVTPEGLHAHLSDPNVRVVGGRPPNRYAQGRGPDAAKQT
ncbi:MAG TPA: hypothetical protein VFE37_02535 [Chloroflexota bacterium]|nr:hypothetical protein [Chloroflexota bacterium]